MWNVGRLVRTIRSLLALINDLEHHTVRSCSGTEGVSTTAPVGRTMLTVMSAFAQLERDQLVERIRAGRATAAEHRRKAAGGAFHWLWSDALTCPDRPAERRVSSVWVFTEQAFLNAGKVGGTGSSILIHALSR